MPFLSPKPAPSTVDVNSYLKKTLVSRRCARRGGDFDDSRDDSLNRFWVQGSAPDDAAPAGMDMHGRARKPKPLARNAKNPRKTKVLERRGQDSNNLANSQPNRGFPTRRRKIRRAPGNRANPEAALMSIITNYNSVRLHSVFGFKPPRSIIAAPSRVGYEPCIETSPISPSTQRSKPEANTESLRTIGSRKYRLTRLRNLALPVETDH
jgi:hypothetical protein